APRRHPSNDEARPPRGHGRFIRLNAVPGVDLPSCWLQPLRGMSVRRTLAELRPKAEIRSEVHRRGKSGVCNDGEEILACDRAGITPHCRSRSDRVRKRKVAWAAERTGTQAPTPAQCRGWQNRRVAITAGISTSRLLLPLPTTESCASPNL